MLKHFQTVKLIRHMQTPDPRVLWLGEGEELLGIFQKRRDLTGLYVYSAGDTEGLAVLAGERQVHLYVSNMDLLELYEHLSFRQSRYQEWKLCLAEAYGRNHDIQDILTATAEIAGGTLILLNTAFCLEHLGGAGCADDFLVQEIIANGELLSPEHRERLKLRQKLERGSGSQLPEDHDEKTMNFECMDAGKRCWLEAVPMPDGSGTMCYLLFVTPFFDEEEMNVLIGIFIDNLYKTMERSRTDRIPAGDYPAFMTAVINQELSEEEELEYYMRQLLPTPKRRCNIAVIKNGAITKNGAQTALTAQLQAVFPDSNVGVVGNEMIVLLSSDSREFQLRPECDLDLLSKILSRYNAFIAFSNATHHRKRLRTQYLLAENTLRLGRTLCGSSRQRIFFFEDYAEYIMIDFCVRQFRKIMGHDDLIFLTHPDAVKVYHYDCQHQSDLLNVLYYYCINNGNISTAAQAAFMHRNTFSSKLSELKKLISADLSDGTIQQRMIFSYKVFRYCSCYFDQKMDVSLNQRIIHDYLMKDEHEKR